MYEVPAAEHKAPCAKIHQAVDGLDCLPVDEKSL